VSNNKQNLGRAYILVSAFCFYFSTVPIKLSQNLLDSEIPVGAFVAFRFGVGFILLSLFFLFKREYFVVEDYRFVVGRALTNFIAVWLFFMGVSLTTASEGNILNLTFPIFVSLISLKVFADEKDYAAVWLSVLAFVGIYLVAKPEGLGFRPESLWALGSGIVASSSVIFLKLARANHNPFIILFYMFAIGTVLSLILFYQDLMLIDYSQSLVYVLAAGICGFIAQYCVTEGIKYITAAEAGIVATTRILIAAILGPYVALEMPLNTIGWVGALIIFSVNVRLYMRPSSS